MTNFHFIQPREIYISSNPSRCSKVWGCVVPIVRLGSELLVTHYLRGGDEEDVIKYFHEKINFLECNLFDPTKRKALILGGEPKIVLDIQEYFRNLGIEILKAKNTIKLNYPRREIYIYPSEGLVHETLENAVFTYNI